MTNDIISLVESYLCGLAQGQVLSIAFKMLEHGSFMVLFSTNNTIHKDLYNHLKNAGICPPPLMVESGTGAFWGFLSLTTREELKVGSDTFPYIYNYKLQQTYFIARFIIANIL